MEASIFGSELNTQGAREAERGLKCLLLTTSQKVYWSTERHGSQGEHRHRRLGWKGERDIEPHPIELFPLNRRTGSYIMQSIGEETGTQPKNN